MGSASSRPRPGLLVTLDAQGTLYRFREPIAAQYIQVARSCGVKAPIDEKELMNAFKRSFKDISKEYPNYGKGQLDSPRAWWKSLTNDAFRRVLDEKEIPEELAHELYIRFSSAAAYELYPDVLPFFSSMRQLKDEYPQSDDPAIFVGVVSNGDPRVKPILQSLGLRVGSDKVPGLEPLRDRANRALNDVHDVNKSPWHNAYNRQNDIDVLTTSYEAGFEKPHSGPFRHAERLATMNFAAKIEQVQEDWSPTLELVKHKAWVARQTGQFKFAKCIHVGDDHEKDYLGATDARWDALHLAREGEQDPGPEGTNTVADLEEAAMAIRILAVEHLGSSNRHVRG